MHLGPVVPVRWRTVPPEHVAGRQAMAVRPRALGPVDVLVSALVPRCRRGALAEAMARQVMAMAVANDTELPE